MDQDTGIITTGAKRFKEIEQENSRLKRLVADLSMDNATLKEAAPGKFILCYNASLFLFRYPLCQIFQYPLSANEFDTNSVLRKKNRVIYFYPKDDSPGCTKEACSFRDQYKIFRAADAIIIGISSDDVERRFAEKYRLTYSLLSDEGNKVRKLFGVPSNHFGLIGGRVTDVVNKQGIVVHLFNSQTEAEKHIEESIKSLKYFGENI